LGVVVNEAGLVGMFTAISSRSGDLQARYTAMQTALRDGGVHLQALDVPATLMTLRSKHGEVQAALATRVGPTEISVQVNLLDPMPILAPLLPKIERVKVAYATRVEQFSTVVTAVAPTLQALEDILEVFQAFLAPLDLFKDMGLPPLRQ